MMRKPLQSVINSVILEGKYTALTNLFTEEEERAFIAGLCDRSALFVAEVARRDRRHPSH